MRCPNCGKEISDGQSYCNACGSVLYGPRNVNLNNPGKAVGSAQSNDISSITGIDINSLRMDIGDDVNYNSNYEEPEVKKEHKKLSISVGTLVFVIVIALLLGVTIYLFITNSRLKKGLVPGDCPSQKENGNTTLGENITKKYVTGYYALSGCYAFMTPNNWRYSEVGQDENTCYTALTNDDDLSMLLAGKYEAKLSSLNKERMVGEYYNESYMSADLKEGKIGDTDIVYVNRFNETNKMYYTDFYMDYNGDSIVYGQIYSKNENPIDNDQIKTILKSIILLDEKNNIQYQRYPIDFDKVFEKGGENQQA